MLLRMKERTLSARLASAAAMLALLLCVAGYAAAQEDGAADATQVTPANPNGPEPSEGADEQAEHAAEDHGHDDHQHDGHGHHDETDLSEANASENLTSPADLRFDLALATLVVFLLLLGTLYKFAWGPIAQGLERREQSIAGKIAEAKQAAEAAEARLREYEAKLAEATSEAREIVSKAMADAQKASERIIAEAQERAAREQQRALADIDVAKNVALESISQKSVNLAMSLASRILHKELNEADHAQLIRESLEKLPSRN